MSNISAVRPVWDLIPLLDGPTDSHHLMGGYHGTLLQAFLVWGGPSENKTQLVLGKLDVQGMNRARPECGQCGSVWTIADCLVLTLDITVSMF